MGEERAALRPAGGVAHAGGGGYERRLQRARRRLWKSGHSAALALETVFFAPRFLFVELFKHRDRLLAATRLPEDKLLEALNELLESLQLVEAASIPVGIWMQARRLCDVWT